jgi:hypothetical protein
VPSVPTIGRRGRRGSLSTPSRETPLASSWPARRTAGGLSRRSSTSRRASTRRSSDRPHLTDGVWAAPVDVSALASSAGSPSPTVAMTPDGQKVVGCSHSSKARCTRSRHVRRRTPAPRTPTRPGGRERDGAKRPGGGVLLRRAAPRGGVGGGDRRSRHRSRLVLQQRRGDVVVSGYPVQSHPHLEQSRSVDECRRFPRRGGVAGVRQLRPDTDPDAHTGRRHLGAFRAPLAGGPEQQQPADQRGRRRLANHVVWANETVLGVQSAHAVGDTWAGPGAVSEPGPAVFTPDVASSTDGLRVSAVWNKSNTQILSSESDDGGATWVSTVSTSAAAAGTGSPRIAAAASGFRFAAVWVRPDGTNSRIQAGTYFEARSQDITFSQPGDLTVGASATLTATATSGLPVTLTTTTPAVCAVAGNQLTALAAGTCSIVASQPGDVDFLAAADVTRTVATVRGQQRLACAKTPPARLKKRGKTVVLPKKLPYRCRSTGHGEGGRHTQVATQRQGDQEGGRDDGAHLRHEGPSEVDVSGF